MPASGQSISILKRTALWHAHSKRCAYCREPLGFGELVVDHVLPQRLVDDIEAYSQVSKDLNLPEGFDLLDYGNWLPSHNMCNLQKGKTVFERGAARYFLSIAEARAEKAREKEKELREAFKGDRILADLHLGLERGLVQKADVVEALRSAPAEVRSDTDPVVLSFSVNAMELMDTESLPDDAPRGQIARDDWFEANLKRHIESIVSSPFFYPEPSERNGETVTVRIAIVDPDEEELDQLSPDYWELLDIDRFSLLYHYVLAATEDKNGA